MNLTLEARLGGDTVTIDLEAADAESREVGFDSDDPGAYAHVTAAMHYLSGLDGKTVTPETATLPDWAIIIGKLAEGDMRVTAGRLPKALLGDPMGEANTPDDEAGGDDT